MQLVFFRLHLMLHIRIARFDVMDIVALFMKSFVELSACLVPKIFQDSPSHRIFRRINEVLNIDKK